MLTKQQLKELLGGKPRRVHFIGIGGVGMSGLARLLHQQGHTVSGSDAAPNGLADSLRQLGVRIQTGHAAANLPAKADLVVFTAAIKADNPEWQAAKTAGLPCVQRGLLLSALMSARHNIAIAGTHGKTTTSSMLAHLLTRSDSAPSFCVGAHVPVLGTNAQHGAGEYFVAEACESDGTLINFAPEIAVCLNVEAEHLDHHGSMDRLLGTFETLFQSTRDAVLYCADCPNCIGLASKARTAFSFGFAPPADYRADQVQFTSRGTRFQVFCRGDRLGEIELVIPGKQNVLNALAAIAVADQLQLPFGRLAEALREFTGAKRRFERKFDAHGITVVDDYAHHPTEIRATINAAKTLGYRRVIAAFQPHRYTRTQALRPEFGTAFRKADKLFLTEIYAASEPPIPGISGETIYEAVLDAGAGLGLLGQTPANPARDPIDAAAVVYEPDLERLADKLADEARPGDLLLIMGAGNITRVAASVADKLRHRAPAIAAAQPDVAAELRQRLSAQAVVRANEPMSRHTTMRVGGPAEFWVEPWDEADLAVLLKFCQREQLPVLLVGRGTNMVVRDGGIAGVVCQLASEPFSRIEADGERITAGGGARLKHIVNLAKQQELGGLEFLEGIPGSLGGALRMNAGAMGQQTFEVIETVRYMSLGGELYEAAAATIPVSYRSCPLLASHVALRAVLRGQKMARSQIDERLREYSERRWATQPPQPSAGCVFKNPALAPAGKLIDETGLKGVRVGGACVSPKHGNFIVNEGGATAQDVLALIGLVRDRVRQERGIELETEVMIVGKEAEAA